MKKKYFVDICQSNAIGIFVENPNDYEIVPVGVRISSMSIDDKNEEYQQIQDRYHISFIFDDNIPDILFYTVPFVEVFAYDQEGVFVRKNEEICYIREGICLRVASNLDDFINNMDSWKSNLVVDEDIIVYDSKEDALKVIDLL